jgi:hypothetical protein
MEAAGSSETSSAAVKVQRDAVLHSNELLYEDWNFATSVMNSDIQLLQDIAKWDFLF